MKRFQVPLAFLATVALFAFLAVITTPKAVIAQGFPPALGGELPMFTNVAALGSTSSLTNTDNSGAKRPIVVPLGSRFGVVVTFSAAGVGTSNLVVGFNGALANDQWTTDLPVTFTLVCAGATTNTTRVMVGTNLGFRFLSLDRLSNAQTNNVTIHRATYTFFVP